MKTFTLTDEDTTRVAEWLDDIQPAYEEYMQKSMGVELWESTKAQFGPRYAGVFSDRLTYKFTPTSIGTFITVTDNATGETLVLEDGSNF